MAEPIYSLICWGGKDGQTVAGATATDILTLTNHGFRTGKGVVAQSTVSGVVTGTDYYVSVINANTFYLYDTPANAIAGGTTGRVDITATTGFVLKSLYLESLSSTARWGGTTRIYNGLAAWRSARNTAGVSAYDHEYAEIGEGFVDLITADVDIDWVAAKTTIATLVDGVRQSDAFHAGVIGATALGSTGYCAYGTSGISVIDITAGDVTVDGIGVVIQNSGAICVRSARFATTLKNCVLRGNKPGGASSQAGYRSNSPSTMARVHDNIVLEVGGGAFYLAALQGAGSLYYNNLAHNSNVGFYQEGSENRGFFYNNIAVGNDTNWFSQSAAIEGAGYNGGESGNTPWNTGAATAITTFDSTDFLDYANHDFRPASSTAPQVETGIAVPGGVQYDVIEEYRPSYIDGTTDKWDLGPFEYDWGNGLPPEVHTIDLSGLVAGSQVIIYTTATTTELLRNNSSGTTLTYDGGNGAVVDYTILKAGYIPIRVTGVSLTATSTPVAVSQQLDRSYATPSGLTFGTNVIVNVTNRVVTSMQVTVATTVQNWYSYLIDCFIVSATNTTLKNVEFPLIPFGEASFTLINGIEFVDGATSISKFSRDGLRYSSDDGVTPTAIWAAILTLDTPAGIQVKYRQSVAGSIINASTTGPMDQLIQVYGDESHGGPFDYRDHMVLRAPKPGYTQPKPDLVATYGNLVDGLFVAALAPILQYATVDADIDAANLVLDNTTKTSTISAPHTLTELYQRAQWWANQDDQWDADIPLTTTDGSTFVQPSNWSMIGVSNLTGGTLSGGSATLSAGVQGIAYNGVTLNIGAAGTYTFVMAGSSTVSATPTEPSNYILGNGSYNGTLTFHNTSVHNITVEIPAGVTTSTTGSPGSGTITFIAPVELSDITISGMTTAVGAYRRLQIINSTAAASSVWQASTAYSVGVTRLRTTGVGDENTAGLYLRCTTAGTSGGIEPTWNTTPGGTTVDGSATWTTYSVLYYDADPASASLIDTYVDGEEFKSGETVVIRFAELDAGNTFKTYSTTTLVSGSGFAAAVNPVSDSVYAENTLDGSSYDSTFSPNFLSNYIVLDANIDFSGKSAYAYFCFTLTSSNGMYKFWGGVTALDTGNYRIETDVLNLFFDETVGFVKQTDDVRIFRKDGLRPALDPTTGGNGIEINWRTPVSVVSTGGSAMTPTESAHLLSLSNAPAATVVAGAVRTEISPELTHLNTLTNAPSAVSVAGAVRTELTTELDHLDTLQNGLTNNQLTMLQEIYALYGLDPTKPLIVNQSNRSAGAGIIQQITSNSTQTTVTRI